MDQNKYNNIKYDAPDKAHIKKEKNKDRKLKAVKFSNAKTEKSLQYDLD